VVRPFAAITGRDGFDALSRRAPDTAPVAPLSQASDSWPLSRDGMRAARDGTPGPTAQRLVHMGGEERDEPCASSRTTASTIASVSASRPANSAASAVRTANQISRRRMTRVGGRGGR
jgi:hypothetical protein